MPIECGSCLKQPSAYAILTEMFFRIRAENFGPLWARVFRQWDCGQSIEAVSKSGHPMSAITPIADVNGHGAGGPLLTQLGHSRGFESNGCLRPETVIHWDYAQCPLSDQKTDIRTNCCGANDLTVGYVGFAISKRNQLVGADFVA